MVAEQLDTLSRANLKTIVRELMQEVLWEMEQELPDPDEGLELRPEIAERLLRAQEQTQRPLKSLEEVKYELGLDE